MADVILAGVGGQGNVLSARLLAEVALSAGYDVKTSEVHGMAQRGGSVVCTVRWGPEVHSPLVPEGRADFLLAFELLEGLRHLRFLKAGGTAIVNDYRLDPLPVQRGDAAYPENALNIIRSYAGRTLRLEAAEVARAAGNPRALGSVLLGALSHFLEIPVSTWEEAIRRVIPSRAVEVNLRAFALGREKGVALT